MRGEERDYVRGDSMCRGLTKCVLERECSSSFVNQQRKIYHHSDAVSSSAGAVQVVINKTEKNKIVVGAG